LKIFSNILFVASPDADDLPAFKQAIALAKNNQARIAVVAMIEAPGRWTLGSDTF
jgi:hypothetical protein